ncbi:MAG TPA: SDR family oxidoreductase [Actinomycetota bacterium]|nr:SDR family oxidoreductase [Actinomycetota bacterium]
MTDSAVVIAGTMGLGRAVAEHLARDRHVWISSRDAERAEVAAEEIGGATGLALDLSKPEDIAGNLAPVGPVRHLVLAAGERDYNTVRRYDLTTARRLVVAKIVGYTAVVHTLAPRLDPEGAIVLFGGLAKERPYPGSTSISTVNEAVSGMVRTLARELAPIRVNGIHPGIVGDHPEWSTKPPEVLDRIIDRTPLGRLITTREVVSATAFLLEHPSVNGINLFVDGGWMIT